MSEPIGAMRLPVQPGEVINRGDPLEFTWNGRPHQGYAGDTIVSALAAAGERVFSRSMKYHRARGLLTASFHDPGCMVQVGDEPNVRGAHRLPRPCRSAACVRGPSTPSRGPGSKPAALSSSCACPTRQSP